MKPPSFQAFEDEALQEPFLLPIPMALFGHKRAQSPEAASHRLVLSMQVRQRWLEIDAAFTSGSTRDNDLIRLQGDERGIVKRDGAASPKLHFHSKGSLAMAVITPKQGRAENQPDGELLQCRGIILM